MVGEAGLGQASGTRFLAALGRSREIWTHISSDSESSRETWHRTGEEAEESCPWEIPIFSSRTGNPDGPNPARPRSAAGLFAEPRPGESSAPRLLLAQQWWRAQHCPLQFIRPSRGHYFISSLYKFCREVPFSSPRWKEQTRVWRLTSGPDQRPDSWLCSTPMPPLRGRSGRERPQTWASCPPCSHGPDPVKAVVGPDSACGPRL